MDVTNLTTASATAAKPTGASQPVVQGNPLPDRGQGSVRSDQLQTKHPQDAKDSGGQPSAEELRELVTQANDSLQARLSDLKFTVDESTDISVVRVEDSETGEVIRQFPSEAMLAIARALDDMKQGSVFEEQA